MLKSKDVDMSISKKVQAHIESTKSNKSDTVRTLHDIRLVRHRMLYARAALNAKGDIAFGLRHIRKYMKHGMIGTLNNSIQTFFSDIMTAISQSIQYIS